jgi:hypothetical protein
MTRKNKPAQTATKTLSVKFSLIVCDAIRSFRLFLEDRLVDHGTGQPRLSSTRYVRRLGARTGCSVPLVTPFA